jgi:hypothetical protein
MDFLGFVATHLSHRFPKPTFLMAAGDRLDDFLVHALSLKQLDTLIMSNHYVYCLLFCGKGITKQ